MWFPPPSSDPEEVRLAAAYINAMHEYLSYVAGSWGQRFENETKGWGIKGDHWAIVMSDSSLFEKTDEVRRIYKKMAVVLHPDRCAEQGNFQLLQEMYEKNKEAEMKDIERYYDRFLTLKGYAPSKELRCREMTRQLWFLWGSRHPAVDGMFVKNESVDRSVANQDG